MRMEIRPRALDKLYKRRDRIEIPDWQRGKVWPLKKKQKLLDTILKGWHMPVLYFRKVGDETFECVDGQQRLTAIWEFFDNKIALSEESKKTQIHQSPPTSWLSNRHGTPCRCQEFGESTLPTSVTMKP